MEFIVLFYCMLSLIYFSLSAKNMALLAEEICGCKAELLSGGLSGNNATSIITHLWGRQPVLIPYPPQKIYGFFVLLLRVRVCMFQVQLIN